MAGNDQLDQLTVTTRRYIRKNPALIDTVFQQDPLNFYLRQSLKEGWTGGNSINEDIITDVLIGGGYAKGKHFNPIQRQTERQMTFMPKYVQVAVPLYQEDIRVINTGPLAAINLLKGRIDQAYMALGAFVSISTYLNGIKAGYENSMSGLAEMLNDGSVASWDGNTYATYGLLTRATFSPSLDSTPIPVSGAIEYDTMDAAYMSAFYGSGEYEPNLVITTPKGLSYLKSKYQTQQRFQDVQIPSVGFRGLSFNGATVLASRYCPGTHLSGPAGAGTADKAAVTYLNETSNGAVVAYPVGSLGNSGESMFILNARKPWLNYYVSTDSLYGGGFRDFVPEGNSTIIIGQVLLAHQLTGQPRMHRQLYGFTS